MITPSASRCATTAIWYRPLRSTLVAPLWRRTPASGTLLTAALNGSLKDADFRTDPYFGFAVPNSVPGVEPRSVDVHAPKAPSDRTVNVAASIIQNSP